MSIDEIIEKYVCQTGCWLNVPIYIIYLRHTSYTRIILSIITETSKIQY